MSQFLFSSPEKSAKTHCCVNLGKMSFQIGDEYMELSGDEGNGLDSSRNTLGTEDRDNSEEDNSVAPDRPKECATTTTTGTSSAGLLTKQAR